MQNCIKIAKDEDSCQKYNNSNNNTNNNNNNNKNNYINNNNNNKTINCLGEIVSKSIIILFVHSSVDKQVSKHVANIQI